MVVKPGHQTTADLLKERRGFHAAQQRHAVIFPTDADVAGMASSDRRSIKCGYSFGDFSCLFGGVIAFDGDSVEFIRDAVMRINVARHLHQRGHLFWRNCGHFQRPGGIWCCDKAQSGNGKCPSHCSAAKQRAAGQALSFKWCHRFLPLYQRLIQMTVAQDRLVIEVTISGWSAKRFHALQQASTMAS